MMQRLIDRLTDAVLALASGLLLVLVIWTASGGLVMLQEALQ